jgi:hypothetical protein
MRNIAFYLKLRHHPLESPIRNRRDVSATLLYWHFPLNRWLKPNLPLAGILLTGYAIQRARTLSKAPV